MRRMLRFGMVGGGPGAFIGAVHQRAAELDGRARLVAGAFSSDAARSREHGRALGLDADRVYDDFRAMAGAEAERGDDRIDFVVIVTPNHLHHEVATAFLERDIHVVCDKPLTTTLPDALSLQELATARDRLLAVTYVYSGYPMIRQARALVAAGAIGRVRRISVQYTQGWLAEPVERTGQKGAVWRTDPAMAGAGALGDIGVHAYHMMSYVSGREPQRLFADVATHVEGRRVDDDAAVLLQYEDGARGLLVCTQIAGGMENDVLLRVSGEQGTLEWSHARHERLVLYHAGGGQRVYTRAGPDLAAAAARATRLPPGHPEGFHDAFANLYADLADVLESHAAVSAARGSQSSSVEALARNLDLPTAADGVAGVRFVEAALRSSRANTWVDLTPTDAA